MSRQRCLSYVKQGHRHPEATSDDLSKPAMSKIVFIDSSALPDDIACV